MKKWIGLGASALVVVVGALVAREIRAHRSSPTKEKDAG